MPLYALWVTLLLPRGVGHDARRGALRHRLAAVPKLQAVEQAVSREGLKLVLLTRLSPAFLFSLLNLAYGLSEVSLRDYTIGLIGNLPGTILFCGLGAWGLSPPWARCGWWEGRRSGRTPLLDRRNRAGLLAAPSL